MGLKNIKGYWSYYENGKFVEYIGNEKALKEWRRKKEAKPEVAHVAHNSGNNEWYTPQSYIEAARRVMGNIDVDPASSEIANKTVKAEIYYTEKDDGRRKNWIGNVWLNPPYAQPLISEFCELVVKKYWDKEIKQACILVNNATETNFYQNMANCCSAICLIKGRVKFIDKQGIESGAPLQGQTVLYFGDNKVKFAEIFSQFGVVLYAK
jgi:ParB family chromosome partitioning protein